MPAPFIVTDKQCKLTYCKDTYSVAGGQPHLLLTWTWDVYNDDAESYVDIYIARRYDTDPEPLDGEYSYVGRFGFPATYTTTNILDHFPNVPTSNIFYYIRAEYHDGTILYHNRDYTLPLYDGDGPDYDTITVESPDEEARFRINVVKVNNTDNVFIQGVNDSDFDDARTVDNWFLSTSTASTYQVLYPRSTDGEEYLWQGCYIFRLEMGDYPAYIALWMDLPLWFPTVNTVSEQVEPNQRVYLQGDYVRGSLRQGSAQAVIEDWEKIPPDPWSATIIEPDGYIDVPVDAVPGYYQFARIITESSLYYSSIGYTTKSFAGLYIPENVVHVNGEPFKGVGQIEIHGDLNKPKLFTFTINNVNGKNTNRIMVGDLIECYYHPDRLYLGPKIFTGKVYKHPDYTRNVCKIECLDILTEYDAPVRNFSVLPGERVYDIIVRVLSHQKEMYGIEGNIYIDSGIDNEYIITDELDVIGRPGLEVMRSLLNVIGNDIFIHAEENNVHVQKMVESVHSDLTNSNIINLERDFLSRNTGAVVVIGEEKFSGQFPEVKKPGSIISQYVPGIMSDNDCYVVAKNIYTDLSRNFVNNLRIKVRDRTLDWKLGSLISVLSDKYGLDGNYILTSYSVSVIGKEINTDLTLGNVSVNISDFI